MTAFDTAEITRRLRTAGCVFAEEEARLLSEAATSDEELAALLARRIAGTPLEHLLGWVQFRGLRIGVRDGVFVPRQRSALLVDEALTLATNHPVRTVVDLCCGSGALGLALRTGLGSRPVELVAADIDPVAVACARDNLAAVGGRVHQGDLFDALPEELRGRIDILLANTPYVPSGLIARLPPEARDHEPQMALDGGPDGLTLARRTAAAAAGWLAPGGSVLIEIGIDQVPAATDLLTAAGLTARIVRSPDLDATVAVGRRPALLPAGVLVHRVVDADGVQKQIP
jgi:release factor glutamine methyltransferase